MSRRATTLAVTIAAASAACQAVLGLGDLSPASTPDAASPMDAPSKGDAGSRDAGSHDTGADHTTSNHETGTDAGCPVVYVSPGGEDTNGGCSLAEAKASIASALLTTAPEIDVCAGMYIETNLTIARPVALTGGFVCANGTVTPPKSYASPGSPAASQISPPSAMTNVATLTIAGPTVTGGVPLLSSITVRGFVIQGPSNVANSAAVSVHYASPLITQNFLTGGVFTGDSANDLTSGLLITTAKPEVSENTIDFSSTTSSGPEVGVLVSADGTTNSAAYIHDNTIVTETGTVNGASGSGGAGVVGLAFVSTGSSGSTHFTVGDGNPVFGNRIVPGTGINSSGGSQGSIGVLVGGDVTVDLIENVISGGTASAAIPDGGTSPWSTAGVAITDEHATVAVGRNRIWGGQGRNNSSGTRGIYASGGTLTIGNNLIHGGDPGTNVTYQVARAIEMSGVTGGIVQDNTLYAGTVPTNGSTRGSAYAIEVNNCPGLILRGNIFAGPADAPPAEDAGGAELIGGCTPPAPVFERNLFLEDVPNKSSASWGNMLLPGHCFSADTTRSLKALESADAGSFGNFALSQACDPTDLDAGLCAPACPDAGCAAWLLRGFEPTTTTSGVLDAGSWGLRDGAPCPVARGGVYLPLNEAGSGLIIDIADASRLPDASSMGARQYTGACTNP